MNIVNRARFLFVVVHKRFVHPCASSKHGGTSALQGRRKCRGITWCNPCPVPGWFPSFLDENQPSHRRLFGDIHIEPETLSRLQVFVLQLIPLPQLVDTHTEALRDARERIPAAYPVGERVLNPGRLQIQPGGTVCRPLFGSPQYQLLARSDGVTRGHAVPFGQLFVADVVRPGDRPQAVA